MRLGALGEGGKLTQPLCLVMFSLLLCLSLLDLKIVHCAPGGGSFRKVALDLVWTLQIWVSSQE